MSRTNRLIQLVFSDIVGSEDKQNAAEKFLATDKALNITPILELFQYKELYEDILIRVREDLNTLSELEEKIVQLRCLSLVGEDIKLSLVREYIYARALFYRKGKESKDIRVIVGTTETYGDNIDALYTNVDFMKLANVKLTEAMKEELKNISPAIEKIKATKLFEV